MLGISVSRPRASSRVTGSEWKVEELCEAAGGSSVGWSLGPAGAEPGCTGLGEGAGDAREEGGGTGLRCAFRERLLPWPDPEGEGSGAEALPPSRLPWGRGPWLHGQAWRDSAHRPGQQRPGPVAPAHRRSWWRPQSVRHRRTGWGGVTD